MKQWLILSTTSVCFLAGCVNTPDNQLSTPESPAAIVQPRQYELEDVNCLAMPVTADKQKFSVVLPFNEQYIKMPTGNSPFVAYQIPPGHFKVTIDSFVVQSSNSAELFYPEVALLNNNKEIIRTIGGHEVHYIKPGFVKPEGVSVSVDTTASGASCLLVYTTDKQRSVKTLLMNEAKEYAKVHGVVPAPFPDTYANHGDKGQLIISIKGQPAALAPVVITAGMAALPESDTFSEAMKKHYLDGVKKALVNGDLDRAIELRSELKELSKATQGYFSSQYGKAADKVIMPRPPMKEEGFLGRALYHYQSEVGRNLQSGQASSALKQLDYIKQWQDIIDMSFNPRLKR